MKENMPKETKKKKSKLPWLILFVIASFMLIKGATLQPQISDNNDKRAELEAQIDYEQQRAEEIDNIMEKVGNDEYIEKIAREKLGMIKKDEIVFIDVTGSEEE